MDGGFLACGPYFGEADIVASLVTFLLAKPFTYFLYVRAFRYRVSAAIPMSGGRAAMLAFQRMLLGIILIGGGSWCFVFLAGRSTILLAWVYLYVARIFAWWLVGSVGASIRGRRLVGWIVGGMLVNITFDFAAVVGFMEGWMAPTGIVAALLVLIAILDWRGRRAALLAPFTEPICSVCKYNLTGNLSGICPECGTTIDLATLRKIPVSTPDAASH